MKKQNKFKYSEYWIKRRLGSIASSEKGKKPKNLYKEKKNGLIPYIDIKAFEEEIFRRYTDGVNCRICEEGDLLMVWDGSRSGLVGFAYKGAIGSTITRINVPVIDKNFVFYFLNSKFQEINTRVKGTGTPHVDPNLLWNYDFPIPPLPEQHEIVRRIEAMFSELDHAVENLKKAQEQLKTYRQSVLKHAFEGKLTEKWLEQQRSTDAIHRVSRLEPAEKLLEKIKAERQKRYEEQLKEWEEAVKKWDADGKQGNKPKKPQKPKELPEITEEELKKLPDLPKDWKWVKLGNINTITMGQSPPGGSYNTEGKGVPLINGPVEFGKDPFSKTKKIKFTTDPKKMCNKDDLILCVRGSTTGRINIAGFDSSIGRGVCAINAFINQMFVNYFINFHRYNIFKIGIGTTFPSISSDQIANINFPLPNLNEQNQIVQEIEQRLSVADNLEKSIEDSLQKAETLRQSILKQAFEGKLTKNWRQKHPELVTGENSAERLLEKIKEE